MLLEKKISQSGIAYYANKLSIQQAKPLLFVHGVGLRAESWIEQIKPFVQSYPMFAIDLPGHGQSQALVKKRAVINNYVYALKQFTDELAIQNIIIIGHSIGAIISSTYAAMYHENVKGLIAISGIYNRDNDAFEAVKQRSNNLNELLDNYKANKALDISSIYDAPIKRWFGKNPSKQEKINALLCQKWLQNADLRGYATAYAAFANTRGISDKTLLSLQCPSRFLTGQKDINSTPLMSEMMAQKAKYSQSIIINEAKHMVQMTHPQKVNNTIIELYEQSQSLRVSFN